MDEKGLLTVSNEQPYEMVIEVLQEMVAMKQGMIEQMRRYHLCTVQLEREVEQMQHEIERCIVK